jgi:hypothetical protein
MAYTASVDMHGKKYEAVLHLNGDVSVRVDGEEAQVGWWTESAAFLEEPYGQLSDEDDEGASEAYWRALEAADAAGVFPPER